MKHTTLALLFASASLLSACGGGDDAPAPAPAPAAPPVTSALPDAASANVPQLIVYLKALVAIQANTLEPVSLSTFTPPVSNTTEPDAVN